MNRSMVMKDLKRNKAINLALLLFIVLSAFLMSVGTMISIQLFGSIDAMYTIARPPHFMQMHLGDINRDDIDEFAQSAPNVEDWQAVEMVNIYGGNIWITKPDGTTFSMSDNLLDKGFVSQNEQYDLLLDMENKPLYPEPGEIGVPLILLNDFDMEVGDTLTIRDGDDYAMEFIVSAYVRDGQMNSTLSSSTRFLINEQDHVQLKENTGQLEYLIEFYLTDPSQAATFQTAYENAGLPANGQAVTYAIIRLLSGFSDMIMVVVMVLVSFFLLLVVFLCLRFTILAALEDEIKSIGTMRAIGMSHTHIRQMYLLKYKALAIVGCSLGYMISLFAHRLFTSHINDTFGKPDLTWVAVSVPVLAVMLVYALEVYYCRKTMKKMEKITVVEALASGRGRNLTRLSRLIDFMSLSRFKNAPVDLFVGMRQVMATGTSWLVMFFVMLIATSIVLVPVNLLNTFRSPQLVTYMGLSINDIIISVSGPERLYEKHDEIAAIIDDDADVMVYSAEARVVHEAMNKDGKWINVHVDSSAVAETALQYLEGNVPGSDSEIALSIMNANELGAKAGDTLSMRINGEEKAIFVSGIYQDVTSGGYTSKMVRPYDPEAVERYSFFVNLHEGVDVGKKVETYQQEMGFDVKVTDMEEFGDQTFGGVTRQLSRAVYAVAVMAMCLAALITLLFIKLQTAKEYSQIAIMKAVGFSVQDIRNQYLAKASLVSLTGIIAGTILANTLGEAIVGRIFNLVGMGISKITFIINPLEAYFLYPSVILAIVLAVTWYCTAGFKRYHIIHLINE